MGNKKNPRTDKGERRTAKTARSDRLAEIRRKVKEGFYTAPEFSERLAEILIEKAEICGESDDEANDEIIRKSLATEIYDNYQAM